MKIIVDTREQKPLKFNHPYITEIISRKCEVGDYGCSYKNGHEAPIYFERKSVSDLFSTLSTGYKRFKKEIIRAKESKVILAVIVEGTLSKVLKGIDECERSGAEIVQQTFTLLVRYHLPFIYCKDRDEMSRFIQEFYLAYGREYINQKDK